MADFTPPPLAGEAEGEPDDPCKTMKRQVYVNRAQFAVSMDCRAFGGRRADDCTAPAWNSKSIFQDKQQFCFSLTPIIIAEVSESKVV